MAAQRGGGWSCRRPLMLLFVVVPCLAATAGATAQEGADPGSSQVLVRAEASTAVASASRPSLTSREAELEDRLLRMEEMFSRLPSPEEVGQLQSQVARLTSQVDRLSSELREARRALAGAAVETEEVPGAGFPADFMTSEPAAEMTAPGSPAGPPAGVDFAEAIAGEVSEEVGFAGVAAGFGPAAELPSLRFDMPGEPTPAVARARWGPGFQIRTDDDEFDIQFHNLTQVDGRFYGISNQRPVADTFGLARQWFVFNGHLTRPYEYYVSFNDSFGAFDALDVFLNVNYDKRLQFMAGRFKSPYAYEFYAQPTQSLATGEWSVFFNNFGMNRDVGLMLWGESVADRIDYAAGIFNGTPNAQFDLSNPKALIAFLNAAPFRPSEGAPLENFNVGGSVVAGDQDHIPVPQELRTIVPVAGSNVLGVPFLTFNNNVIARGRRNLWSLHAAYFYRSLTLMGEWQSGVESYALSDVRGSDVALPLDSFYVQASYFLTGERVASRGMLKPRRPFDLRPGKFGPGAWEVVFRYADLDIGHQVFSTGLANPDIWTNRLFVTDLAVNWYWTTHLRVMFDWQHAGFGSPVIYAPPKALSKSSDLFILRFSVWF